MSILSRSGVRSRVARLTALLLIAGCGGEVVVPTPPVRLPVGSAASLMILGDSVTAAAGDTMRVRVLVTDSVGRPVPDVLVYFNTDSTRPGYQWPTPSDSTGIATGFLQVPQLAGVHVMEAAAFVSAPDHPTKVVSRRFSARVRAGPVALIAIATTPTLGIRYATAVAATPGFTLFDRYGNRASARSVTFRSEPSGSVGQPTQVSDSVGQVAPQPWTLGEALGDYRLIASVDSQSVTLTARVVSGTPSRLTVKNPGIPAIAGNATYGYTASVVDAKGSGVPGYPLVWTARSTGAVVCSGVTSAEGLLDCGWKAVVTDSIVVSAGSLRTAIAVEVAPRPKKIEIIDGPPPNTTYPRAQQSISVTVRVTGDDGAPIAGLLFNQQKTDAQGIARLSLGLPGSVGPATFVLRVNDVPEVSASFTIIVIGPTDFSSIVAGDAFTCGRATSASWAGVHCWGRNAEGQLAVAETDRRLVPTPSQVDVPFYYYTGTLSAGATHFCISTSYQEDVRYPPSHPLICWGGNDLGQVVNPPSRSTKPVVDDARVGAAGGKHTCVFLGSPHIYCWGSNASGELGDGTRTSHASHAAVGGSVSWSNARISSGRDFTCAVNGDGLAYCWGHNDVGQLGDGTTTDRLIPTLVAGSLSFAPASITSGGGHACALDAAGHAYCWGRNIAGQLGDGTTTNRITPVAVLGNITFTSIEAGESHTCGVASTGTIYCWGANNNGQAGIGSPSATVTRPTAVSGGIVFRAVTAGLSHTCAIRSSDDRAFCWGLNDEGQLGDGTTISRYVPTQVADYRP